MPRFLLSLGCACFALAAATSLFAQTPAVSAASAAPGSALSLEQHGQYVFRVAGCLSCHTAVEKGAVALAGGRALKTPFGDFYSPNITPHPEHGIGRWSLEDFTAALREGVSPDGYDYYPVFPYTSYTRMRTDDIAALHAYLRAQPSAAAQNREHDIPWYVRWRFFNWLWKLVFLDVGVQAEDSARTPVWNRGAYIANALAHCAECHSPRGLSGAIDKDLRMVGAVDGPEGESAPNLTSDKATGIGRWEKIDLNYYLESGATPGGDYAGGLMAEVIENGLSFLTGSDREALVEYLISLPAVHRPELAH
jgi:mono/diheme cytochrome c family protein